MVCLRDISVTNSNKFWEELIAYFPSYDMDRI
jgi:hypothetical protein